MSRSSRPVIIRSVAGGEDKGAARRRHRPPEEPRPDRLGRHGGRRRHRRRRPRHGRLGKVLLTAQPPTQSIIVVALN